MVYIVIYKHVKNIYMHKGKALFVWKTGLFPSSSQHRNSAMVYTETSNGWEKSRALQNSPN